MNEFFTWAMLGTFAGCTLGTGILTQFLKGMLDKIPTQIVSYVIAVVLLGAAGAFTGTLTGAAEIAMVPLNAILISTAANGGYAAVQRISGN